MFLVPLPASDFLVVKRNGVKGLAKTEIRCLSSFEDCGVSPVAREYGWTGSVPPAIAGGTDLFQQD